MAMTRSRSPLAGVRVFSPRMARNWNRVVYRDLQFKMRCPRTTEWWRTGGRGIGTRVRGELEAVSSITHYGVCVCVPGHVRQGPTQCATLFPSRDQISFSSSIPPYPPHKLPICSFSNCAWRRLTLTSLPSIRRAMRPGWMSACSSMMASRRTMSARLMRKK